MSGLVAEEITLPVADLEGPSRTIVVEPMTAPAPQEPAYEPDPEREPVRTIEPEKVPA